MTETAPILIGKGEKKQYLLPGYANRHGLITGATGTGKTVTLQVLAEGFSRIGVPAFLADVKGDLSGLSQPIPPHPKVNERIENIGIDDFAPTAWPVVFWDVFGDSGHPVRTTISEMGPLLLSALLELNDTQEGVLNVAFRVADEQGLLLLDLEDLRSKLSGRTRLVAVGAASNAVGTLNPVREICDMAHDAGAHVFIDAVHLGPHGPIDVAAWDCDYAVCSAYKFFGPHTGMLYGRFDLLRSLDAYRLRPAPADPPGKWETGTQSFESLAGVGHKTASVVMAQAFGVPAFPVDTHIHRLAMRWGLSAGKNVEQVERDLKNLIARLNKAN